MSDYSKSFLREDTKKEPGPKIWLAAFGKHPGWNDHVEDLGLETQSLLLAKAIMYVQGIGGQVDAGAWEKLDAAQQLPVFNHVFLWRRGSQFLLGKMWSSSDGKGRTRYPMILCAQCGAAPLGWAVNNILPRLDEAQTKCMEATSAEAVRRILARTTADLRGLSSLGPAGTGGVEVPLSERRAFVDSAALGPDRQGLFRVVHQINSQMLSYAGDPNATKVSDLRPQQIRLPRAVDSVAQSLLLWDQVFQIMLLPGSPLLFMLSLEQPWLDVTAGEPGTHEFFSLRATDKNIPPASTIPYNLDENTRQRAQQLVDALLGNAPKKLPDPPAPPKGGPISGLTAFFSKAKAKWLVITLVAVVAVVLAAIFRPSHGNPRAAPNAEAQSTADADAKARAEVEQTRLAAEARAKMEAEAKAAEQARLKQQQEDLAAKEKAEAEAKAGEEANAKEARERALAAEKAKMEAEAKASEEARQKSEAEIAAADAKAKADAEAKAKADEDRLAAEEQAKKDAALAQAKADAEAKAQRDATEKALAQQQLLAKAAQDQKAADQTAQAANNKIALVATTPAPAPAPIQPVTITGQQPDLTAVSWTNSAGIQFVWFHGGPAVFGVGVYEITQGQYFDVMQTKPSKYTNGPLSLPVESVTGNDAIQFCKTLTDREHANNILAAGWKYTLPTDDEWKAFSAFSADTSVVGAIIQREHPEPVGGDRAPNKFGLYDVIGNVAEWCFGPDGKPEFAEGGGFSSRKFELRHPLQPDPAIPYPAVGFRVVLVPAQ